MAVPLYVKHDLLDKISSILSDCYPNELMSAHEIALELQRRHPQTVEALGKPVGGIGKTQNTLTRYIARIMYPARKSPAEAKQRFVAYIFGRNSVATIQFKDGTSQSMHPAYGLALFALRRPQ